MWPNFADLAIIYAVLTPATVLYWHTTALLLNQWVGHNAAKLLLGFASAAGIYYLHDTFRSKAPTGSPLLLSAYETTYDYFVKLSCLCYYFGCRTIYDALMATGLLRPADVAILAGGLLIAVRGFSNVLSIPIVVDNDNAVERYRPLSPLNFRPGMLFVDTLTFHGI